MADEKADAKTDEKPGDKAKADDVTPEPKELSTVTSHQAQIGGATVAYDATAGTIVLRDEKAKPKAEAFYVSYVRTDVDDPARPVTFCFNGGPGASSIWLHVGALGPRLARPATDGIGFVGPFALVDNEHSLLDVTDLVFIDPMSTGFTRPAGDEDPKAFHGVDEDVRWVAEFIRMWTTRNGRWTAPKFLAGESYGTFRAAALSSYLQDRVGMFVNGIALISCVLQFQTLSPTAGNDIPYVVYLPSYAAIAWYHGLHPAGSTLEEVVAAAEEFAFGAYATGLLHGAKAGDTTALAAEIARHTGLSPTFVERANLRVDPGRFVREVLRDRGQTVGRFDARITGVEADDAGERNTYDPSYGVVQAPYVALFNHYVRAELGFESDLVYEFLTNVNPWKFGPTGDNRFADSSAQLSAAMRHNPEMKVLVASGWYDLATPFAAAEWTMAHLTVPAETRANVRTTRYPAGHMMYVLEDCLAQLRADLGALIAP